MIEFPPVAAPTVSVVLITYGGWEWTEPALQALVENTPACYEVVLVDNASPDGTADRVAADVRGATLVFNEQNYGFGLAANQGALYAVGRYVLFLNSDAYVQPGWLAPLLEVLDGNPRVGAVAPCLIEPDGRLQEAAGLVGGDGWVGQFGMGADAAHPEFRFRREVDYASAAALLVRRRDFLAVGGFDPAYVMGYYEDVDLCLTLAERGLATVYEPRSQIVHLRGASGTQEIAMRHAVPNHAVFVEKWQHELSKRPPATQSRDYPHRVTASRDARTDERVLIVAGEVPSEHGPGARLAWIASTLATRWPRTRVTLVAAGFAPVPDVGAAEVLLRGGVEVAWGEDWEAWFAARRFHYSQVWVCGPDAYECFDDLLRRTQPQAARVYDVEALTLDRADGWPDAARASALAAAEARAVRLRDVELRAMAAADVVCCATEEDRAAIAEAAPGKAAFLLRPEPRPQPGAIEDAPSPAVNDTDDLGDVMAVMGGAPAPVRP